MAVGTLGHDGAAQRVVRAPGGSPALGVSSLWIWHGVSLIFSLLKLSERFPAVVHRRALAQARLVVPVLSTVGTDAFAVLAA